MTNMNYTFTPAELIYIQEALKTTIELHEEDMAQYDDKEEGLADLRALLAKITK